MKYIMLICSLLFGYSTLVAQSSHLIGVETSLQFTNLSTPGEFNSYQYKTGIGGGVSYTYQLPTLFSLSTGILYNPHGFSLRLIKTDEQGKVTGEQDLLYGFDFISIPTKVSVRFGAEKVHGFVSTGLITSFLVNTYTNYPNTAINFQKNVFDLGVLIEVGASYEINNKLQLSARLFWQQNLFGIKTDLYGYNRVYHNAMGTTIALKYRLG